MDRPCIILCFAFALFVFSVSWLCLSVRQGLIYEPGVYDCSEMTEDCKHFFDVLGIKNTVIHGYNYYGYGDLEAHCWLELETPLGSVEFECTTLMFQKTSDNYRNLWVTQDNKAVLVTR